MAERFSGEIICADSRTIYRGMDIGTAKPTAEEQARVPHHLLDVVDPGETLSVAAFKRLAENAIEQIVGRGNVPFIVGGSGLYIDALLFDYQFPAEADPERRKRLDAMTTLELQELLAAEDPEAFEMIDQANRRRLIRAIETVGQDRTRRTEPRAETLILGLGLNKEFVQNRIPLRIEKMLERGLLSEVRTIGETYGWESEAMTGIAYRVFKDVILGTKTESEAMVECAYGEMQLVKKQLTWFKRNKQIQWLDDSAEAEPMVRQFLQK
jgi:tRNA dimethylallyltransferase